MAKDKSPWEDVDRRLDADPIVIGDRTIRPIGRLRGKRFTASGANGAGTGLVAKLQPEEVIIEQDGETYAIALNTQRSEPILAIVMAGAAVSIACLITMFLSRLIVQRIFNRAV
ncbi:MAG: hypothetical protein ACK2UO_15420 [Caldilineaceae bacterium]